MNDYWHKIDPKNPLFRRCGCPINAPCQGHPDDDDNDNWDAANT